jgi:hypothetical protein
MSTTKLKLLNRDAILAADDQQTVDIDVPEWGGQVRIRSLSGSERDHYLASLYTMKPNGQGGMEVASVNVQGSAARLVSLVTIDDTGGRLFSEADVLALDAKNGVALDRVFKAASKLSRLNQTIDQVKADLGVAQNGSSGSV